jgi:hypothetical protein
VQIGTVLRFGIIVDLGCVLVVDSTAFPDFGSQHVLPRMCSKTMASLILSVILPQVRIYAHR